MFEGLLAVGFCIFLAVAFGPLIVGSSMIYGIFKLGKFVEKVEHEERQENKKDTVNKIENASSEEINEEDYYKTQCFKCGADNLVKKDEWDNIGLQHYCYNCNSLILKIPKTQNYSQDETCKVKCNICGANNAVLVRKLNHKPVCGRCGSELHPYRN